MCKFLEERSSSDVSLDLPCFKQCTSKEHFTEEETMKEVCCLSALLVGFL